MPAKTRADYSAPTTQEKIKSVKLICKKIIENSDKLQFLNAISWANYLDKELIELLNRALKKEL